MTKEQVLARRRRALWVRRLLTGGALLLVIALVVTGLALLVLHFVGSEGTSAQSGAQSGEQSGTGVLAQSGSQSGSQSGGQSGAATPSTPPAGARATRDGWVAQDDTVTILPCGADDLAVTVSVTGASVGAGEKVGLTLTNTSSVACATALGDFTLRVVSGDQTFYDSASCTDRDASATPLLLSPSTAWKGTLEWDGKLHAEGCGEGGDTALPGTYRAIVSREGEPVGPEQVFAIY